jgi:hypothetical protein
MGQFNKVRKAGLNYLQQKQGHPKATCNITKNCRFYFQAVSESTSDENGESSRAVYERAKKASALPTC